MRPNRQRTSGERQRTIKLFIAAAQGDPGNIINCQVIEHERRSHVLGAASVVNNCAARGRHGAVVGEGSSAAGN